MAKARTAYVCADCGALNTIGVRHLPTEELLLAQMRASDPPVPYLSRGHAKGDASRAWNKRCWRSPRTPLALNFRKKLRAQDGELYVFAESRDRVAKERSMRRHHRAEEKSGMKRPHHPGVKTRRPG